VIGTDPAVQELHLPVCVGGHLGFVGDHDDGDAFIAVEFVRSSMISQALAGVEIAGRLIRQQHRRARNDCAGDGHTLLLPAGKLAGRVVLPPRQAHPVSARCAIS
jgi:hypothetical protein